MIELKRLTVLHAVAHHGSVTAAARALSYSPSAVSQHLAALERELDVQLVYRTGRRVTMTAAGRELAQRAAVMLELAHDFHAHARNTIAPPARLRVATFPGAIEWLIAPAIASVAGEDTRTEVVVADPDAAVRLVRHRLVDLAVIYQRANHRPSGVRADRLADAPMKIAAAASRGYPPHSIAAAATLPWILPAEGTIARSVTDAGLAAAAVSPRVAATGSTLHAVAALVAAGTGIALLPDFAAAQFAQGLLVRQPADFPLALSVWLIRCADDADRVERAEDELAAAIRRSAGAADSPRPNSGPAEPPAQPLPRQQHRPARIGTRAGLD